MLLKCYHHFHSLFKNAIVYEGVYEDCNLDIFEMTTSTNEPTKEFASHELLSFRRFQVYVLFNGGRSMNLCFIQLDSLLVKF
jgi:hypothetical protein